MTSGTKQGPHELADVTLDVGQDLLGILVDEIGADGHEPDQHFDGHAAEIPTVAVDIEAMEVFKSCSWISGAGISKQWSQHSISLGPLM